eukprot:1166401-Amorphochlora_amoeboformis.AAC.2
MSDALYRVMFAAESSLPEPRSLHSELTTGCRRERRRQQAASPLKKVKGVLDICVGACASFRQAASLLAGGSGFGGFGGFRGGGGSGPSSGESSLSTEAIFGPGEVQDTEV